MENSSSSSSSSNCVYRECLRNHAASLGSYATDGCGEFTLDLDASSPAASLQCAACGCHRNFHRKVTCPPAEVLTAAGSGDMMEYSGGGEGRIEVGERSNSNNKKRFRTKFSLEQKEKMLGFAEKLGWKLQRKEVDDEIERFCRSVGVSRQVFKVWMHNHKNSNNSSANASSLTQ
ncbi:zinc-finger homeodomain protein 11-like [Abrus precatorius]|uniref:Zinc-finger homeodomain protein 11-like n=1 Tax=Abrus precatorius TaxID=3816 RepID=A0A8B8LSW4_ABRPR|nr:zinc-finger homeodomain protein 11-like [Abrus precatorius]